MSMGLIRSHLRSKAPTWSWVKAITEGEKKAVKTLQHDIRQDKPDGPSRVEMRPSQIKMMKCCFFPFSDPRTSSKSRIYTPCYTQNVNVNHPFDLGSSPTTALVVPSYSNGSKRNDDYKSKSRVYGYGPVSCDPKDWFWLSSIAAIRPQEGTFPNVTSIFYI